MAKAPTKPTAKPAKPVETEVEAEAEAPASGKGRKVMLTNTKTGEEKSRVDVIRGLWQEGKKRGEIVKLLKSDWDHECVYQIVFAATKGVEGGPGDEGEGEGASKTNDAPDASKSGKAKPKAA